MTQLTASLGKSEEARLHGREALSVVADVWALHRQAAADTQAESMVSAIGHGEVARSTLARAGALLEEYEGNILDYIERIAPGAGPAVSDKTAVFPDGEFLVAARRPRTLRAAQDFVLREADAGREAATATKEWVQNAHSFFEPPGPTGRHTSQPGTDHTYRTPDTAATGDAVQTLTLLAVVTVKGFQIAVSRLMKKMRNTPK